MSNSKTPQFDAKLDEILNTLVPHSRVCGACATEFTLEIGDVEHLKMLRVPPPTLCPSCRNRRRLSYANYSNIYKRKCDAPGHDHIMIAIIPPIMPWVAYDYEAYYGDAWDPFSYGISASASEPFFGEFYKVLKNIPHSGIRRGADSPNSDFSFYGKHMKDCYYVFGGRRSEDIMFGSSIYDSKHAVDAYFLRNVEISYENISTSECYKCFYAYFSSNSIDCEFIYDCRNCQNCFGCTNLRNKNYCWFNEQLSKSEYEKRRASVYLGDRVENKKQKELFWNFVRENPIRAVRVFQSVNVSGNDIKESNNCYDVFQTENSDNVRHAYFAIMNMKDSMDVNYGGHAERLYETQNVATSANVKFSFGVKESNNCEFMMATTNCSNCFGCVGINYASYCIFNTHYEPDVYWQKLDEIKTAMLERGEYGEYFPIGFGPCAYNSSLANIIYPMTESEVKNIGGYWQPDMEVDTSSIQTLSINELPENINDVPDSICSSAIIGELSGKPFRLVPREVAFYKRYHIALPTDTPHQRMLDRYKILNNFRVGHDVCFSCGKDILSAHRTTDGYKPYCASCYQRDFL